VIWVALWVVLLTGAAVVLGLVGRDVWRKGKALAADLGEASARIDRVMTPLQDAAEELEDRREELAVFSNPETLRRERAKAAKGKGGAPSARRSNGRHRVDPGAARFGATSQGATRPTRERTT
jgi:hypothetical protein